jgi:cytochrome c biogenesis protein CcdA
MKDEILKQFTEKLIGYVNSAEILLKKNVPDYIDQLLKYEMLHHIIILLIGFAILFLWFGIARFIYVKFIKEHGNSENLVILAGVSTIFLLVWIIWFFASGTSHINSIIKINVAPKVFIIDYLRGVK